MNVLPEQKDVYNPSLDDALNGDIDLRPSLFEHHGNHFVLASTDIISQLLSHICFAATRHDEDDGSVTLSADALDIVSHGVDIQAAKVAFVKDILEYAGEYYRDYEIYSRSPNRKSHLPYVIKALAADSPEQLEKTIAYHF